jgi:hypothetical protein
MIDKVIRRIRLLSGDSRWWGFFLQRQFMNPASRRWLAARVARRRPQAPAMGHGAEAVRASAELNEAGITMLGELLGPAACAELRNYFNQREAHDPYRPGSAKFPPHGSGRHPDAHIAHHAPLDVLRAPHLLALANSPRVLDIVARFLGCKPTIGYLAVWWSYPTDKGAQQAERFHRDVDDWRFVKLFVYLTDVGPTSGPHIYVRHSSSSRALTRVRRFEDDEVVRAFGADNVLTMTAAAGQGFLEDTFGMHKGQPVQSGTRLIFQAVYGVSPLPYSPLAPVVHRSDVTVPGIDPWINRAYIA